MKGKHTLIVLLTVGLLFALLTGLGLAKEPAPEVQPYKGFTYQGRLLDNGSPADGEYEAQFRLFDVSLGGTALASISDDLTVVDGLFTVHIMFGSEWFTGDARWLEIALRPTGSPDPYTTLSPRQELTPTPYALALPGLWTQTNTTSPNIIGGYKDNSVTAGVYGAAIGGGGKLYYPNSVTDDYGTVGGGHGNTAQGYGATIGGGYSNQAGPGTATIGGGSYNVADYEGSYIGGGAENHSGGSVSTVGGGMYNDASGAASTIGGGGHNSIPVWAAFYATIGGGHGNTVDAQYGAIAGGGRSDPDDDTTGNRVTDDYGTVGGGGDNQAGDGDANTTDATYAAVGGGLSNEAIGPYATVPGGRDNVAEGRYSFAAGQRARAIYEGSFVWNDSTAADLNSETDDQWITRASGGYYLYTSSGNTGVYVAAGGGAWSSLSDRNMKESLEAVDARAVLEAVAAMPVSTWSYTTEDPSIRHMGPMAQDFHAAFGLGDSDRHINSLDADGVALAAIQGLHAENQELKARLDALESRLAALEGAGQTSGAARLPPLKGAGPTAGLLLGGLAVAGVLVVQRRVGGGR